MLYKLIVALVVAQAAAFGVPAAAAGLTAGRASSVSMAEASWRRSFSGRAADCAAPGGLSGAGSGGVSAAAPSGAMSVAQACTFMASNPGVSFAAKKEFLLEKGVTEFVIAEAACTATDTTLVL